MNAVVFTCFVAGFAAGFAAIGTTLRRAKSVSRWLFFIGLLGLALEMFFVGFALKEPLGTRALRWVHPAIGIGSLLPGVWWMFSLCYSRGNYMEFLTRSRWWLGLVFLVGLLIAFGVPQEQLVLGVVDDKLGVRHFPLGWWAKCIQLLWLCISVLALMNLEQTFRASVGKMRWRVKLLVLGLGGLFVVRIYVASQALVLSELDSNLFAIEACGVIVACFFSGWSFLRLGLVEGDVYPSHAVLYRSLTAILAGAYLVIIGVITKAVGVLGDSNSFPFRALAILLGLVGLPLFIFSDRVRNQIRAFVSRHFHRPMYDHREVWNLCIQRLGLHVEVEDLSRATVKLIAETLNALSVTLWVIDIERNELVFGASTNLSLRKAEELGLARDGSRQLSQLAESKKDPFEFMSIPIGLAGVLKRSDPAVQMKEARAVGVPLRAKNELMGFLLVGERVQEGAFAREELDLLRCIGDQVASGILNRRLSERAVRSREFEAFQAVSTFFVHDLKNTATTLSLMLKNMAVHFDDPEFRADAHRAIERTVDHVNDLTSRLSQIRQGLQLRRESADVSEFVRREVDEMRKAVALQISEEFGDIPKVSMDVDQMRRVLTNLLLNAKEACGSEGTIEVATRRTGPWAVISVRDTGCGMTEEFIRGSLFRPFKTTKKNGLGIGIFQSRMIVEAHEGRIEVESQMGHGSVFRVLLPLPSTV